MGRRRLFTVVLVVILMAVPAKSLLAVMGDIVFQIENESRGTPPAVFPHWVHRVRYKCYACHSAVFEMKAGANPVTMDAIAAGQYCGACHDGKTAWGVGFDTCAWCHIAE
jgi:c(7)-type cytochrome triheme protein